MTDTMNPTAWSALLLGLFTLAAAIGAYRQPGLFKTMIDEIEKSPALQLLSGLAELVAGAIIYLANPWAPADLLACIMKAVGGLMMAEALVVIAMSDVYLHFWLRNMNRFQRGWAALTGVIGILLTAAGMLRFG